jgi:hypothetical protein
MKEAQIQTELSKVHDIHGVFELKLCKTKSIRFDSVKPHQIEALEGAATGGLFHKISDFPMFAGSKTRFNRQKPFDFFFLKKTPSYVVICFYEPRKKKICYYVPAWRWVNLSITSGKKSIREERIKINSYYIIDLRKK